MQAKSDKCKDVSESLFSQTDTKNSIQWITWLSISHCKKNTHSSVGLPFLQRTSVRIEPSLFQMCLYILNALYTYTSHNISLGLF